MIHSLLMLVSLLPQIQLICYRDDEATAEPYLTNLNQTLLGRSLALPILQVNAMTNVESSPSGAGSKEGAFVRGQQSFDAANSPDDYRKAIADWESILADGYQNGAVYYNLGNAYYRLGEYGRAVLCYRKALPFLPGDANLKANLQQAIAASPGRLAEPPKPWWSPILFWTEFFSYSTKAKLCFAMVGAMAFSLFAAVYFRQRRIHFVTLFLFLAAIGLGVDLAVNYDDAFGNHRAVIIAETIARKGTGASYEPAFDQPLRDGAEFRVLNETPGWTLGHFEGIGDGWVRNEFIAR